jgi:virginiamycin A acetyltransferase
LAPALIKRVRGKYAAARQRLYHAKLRRSGVELGENCFIARGSEVAAGTVFERGTAVNGPGVFKGTEAIRLGRYCALGDAVRMISSNHRIDLVNVNFGLQVRLGLGTTDEERGPITVGHSVWIGDAAIVLGGVSLGNGAVVGAGAVVTRDVPPFAVVAGSPARVIRMRFGREAIDRLQALEWWEWTEDEMRSRLEVFAKSYR